MAGKALLHIHDIIHVSICSKLNCIGLKKNSSDSFLYDRMQDSPVSGQCELKDDAGALFAVVSMDLIFAYGNFGFGESFQVCSHHYNLMQEYSY